MLLCGLKFKKMNYTQRVNLIQITENLNNLYDLLEN